MKLRKGIFCLLLCLALFQPVTAYATAGGHSGGSSGGHSSTGGSSRGSHRIIRSGNRVWIGGRSGSVLSFVLFTGGILGITFLKRKRQQHALARTDRNDVLIAMSGSEQEKQALLQDVAQTFQRIQAAWDAGTLESAAHYYTPRLYDEHRRVLADNRENGLHNHTQKVSLVRISNYRQLGTDSFSLTFGFSCLDYTEDQAGRIVTGDTKRKQYFLQRWFFNYDAEKKLWQADFIQPVDLTN